MNGRAGTPDIFTDTSAFVTLIDADDQHHAAALEAWRTNLSAHVPFLTTNYVAFETFAVLQRRFGLPAAQRFVNRMLPAVTLIWVQPEDHDAGLSLVLAERRRRLSWVDCVSFAVMRRLDLTTAFAFDRDFNDFGFTLLTDG